jgi:ComF family protein
VGARVVVPVPVHVDRERQRGYDQAALIADVAARHLGLPMAVALERGRATVAQFELGRDERASNVTGAFRLRTSDPLAAPSIAGHWVLLVDDVVTTGSTLAACAATLERAGALAVSAITVARER